MTGLPVGATVRDTERDRVGVVMDHLGARVQLRPVGGGREWDADPERLEPAPTHAALRDAVAEANAWSRRGAQPWTG